MVAVGRVHRAGGARRAPHSRAVRQTRGRKAVSGRPVQAHAAHGKCRWSYPGDFCVGRFCFPQKHADQGAVREEQKVLSSMLGSPDGEQLYSVRSLWHRVFCLLLRFDSFSIPTTQPKRPICASTADSYQVSPGGRAAHRRIHEQHLTKITGVGLAFIFDLCCPRHHISGNAPANTCGWSGTLSTPTSRAFCGKVSMCSFIRRNIASDLLIDYTCPLFFLALFSPFISPSTLSRFVSACAGYRKQGEAQLIMRHYEGLRPALAHPVDG